MVTAIPGKATVSDIVFSKIHKGSAALQVARLYPFTGSQELIAYNYNGEDARYHDGKESTEKVISDDQLTEVNIITKTLYKWLEFSDREWADNRVVANAIENQTAFDLYRTLDKDAVAGQDLVPSSAFTGYTTSPLTIDGTAASVLAAVDAVASNGYQATAAILDVSFKPTLREAFVENTNTNQLGVSIGDGTFIGDVPVYFRNLGAGVGLVGDFDKLIVAYNNELNVVRYLADSDAYQGRRNKNAIKVSWQVGVGVADQAAFQPVALASADDEDNGE